VAPEGQVQIFVQRGDPSSMSPAEIEEFMLKLLQKEGDVFAFRRQSEQGTYPFKALVEFADLDIAVSIISKYNGASMLVSFGFLSRIYPFARCSNQL
jgi:hypothetical protein